MRQISPFANQIVSLLSPLWDQAGEQYEMKAGILNLLSALGESMGAAFQRYYSLVVPLLQTSLEPSSKTRTYFLEPAILLWQTILERSPSPASPEVVSLVKYLFPLFEDGSDVVPKALAIAELYIYLIPSEFLSNAALILNPLTSLLQAVRAKNSGTVTSLLELLIRSAHSIGGISAVEELTGKMHSSNILDILFSSLLDAYDAHQTTGPNSTQPSIDGLVETDYFNVIARLAIASPSLLISALEAVVSRTQIESLKPAENPIDRLLTEWFSHMDNIGHPAHKKLNCMALTSLLATGQPWILNRLQSLMTVWTDVITEIVTDVSHIAGTEELRDCLVITDSDALEMKEESATHECQRLLKLEEPVYTMDIRDFVRGKLGIAIEGCGGVEIFQRDWVQNVDEDVGRAFGTLGVV